MNAVNLRKAVYLITILLIVSCKANPTHIPTSETMVGIWRQTGLGNPNTGEMMEVLTGNYKVINADKTFFTFVTWGSYDQRKGTTIGQYGSYKFNTENTLVEYIIQNSLSPKMSGTSNDLRYTLTDKNTLQLSWINDSGIMMKELWTRLPF